MNTKRIAAFVALAGAVVVTVGVSIAFGLPGGLISGGLFLVAAASSNL